MSTLGSKAKSSVLWNTGFNLFRDILQFLVMIFLVRLIEPSAYGEFALVTSIIGFIHVFSFNTFIQHVLQVRDDSKINYQLHFTFGFFLQISMFVITNLIAFLMDYFHFYDSVTVYLHVLSIIFFLELFSELRRMELQRDLDWKRMRILHGIGLLMGSALALSLAYAGGGVYALIIPGFMSNVPFIYEMFIIKKWRPTWQWSYVEYKATLNFSKKRIFSGLMASGKPLIENSLFVTLLSFTQLGFYNRAMGLATLLVNKFALQLIFSIYPILTKVEPNTDQFRRIAGLIVLFVAWVIIPIAYIVNTQSRDLVSILYGDKWLAVTPFLQKTSIIMAISAINSVLYSLLLSSNKIRICTFFDFLILTTSVILLFLVLPIGVIEYLNSITVLLSSAGAFLIICIVYLRIVNYKFIFLSIAPPALTIAIFDSLLKEYIYISDNNVIDLSIHGILFMISYIIILRVFFFKYLYQIIMYLPKHVFLLKLLVLNNKVK